jgi:hypothetical protein
MRKITLKTLGTQEKMMLHKYCGLITNEELKRLQKNFYIKDAVEVVANGNVVCDFARCLRLSVNIDGTAPQGKVFIELDYFPVSVLYQSRPPLGLRPKCIVDGLRIKEISEAIERYTQANKEIPCEWLEEYNQLVKGKK